MGLRARLRQSIGPVLRRSEMLWGAATAADALYERTMESAALRVTALLRPSPRQIEVAITAHCNLRCVGCRYGRDFMPGSRLPWPIVRDLLDDAKASGFWEVRFYGGEPLLHPDLPRMVEYAAGIGMRPYVTTNATLLAERIDELYAAGLRHMNIGYYGTGAHYDVYVQRRDRYRRLEAGVAAVRERYGDSVTMRVNWLLMRPSCNLEALDDVCAFAERYGLRIQVDLVHYSLPYFTEGPDRMLQFRPEDRPAVEAIARELVRRKEADPDRFFHSLAGLRSIPDWLIEGPAMRVPCDAHQMIWVGADGSVQLCYVTFALGNLHQHRLRDLLFTPEHRTAARGALALDCPNCHCKYDRRVEKHAPTAARYARALPVLGPSA